MHDVSQYQGRTVLFVSHNMTAIEQLCSGVMLIDKGKILLTGNTVEVINEYLKTNTILSGKIIDAMRIYNNQITVESITINKSTSNIVEISPSENKLDINIRGRIAEERRMAVEVRFFDQYDHLQMLFSPGHLYGQNKLFRNGDFEMNETIILPDSLAKNEFRLTIDITQPNIEKLLSFPNSVKVICKGIQGHTGLEFPATNCGLLMLK
jgi:lipopolysaccharide transport system ATP-binding protein